MSSTLPWTCSVLLISDEVSTAKYIKKAEYNPIPRSFIDRIDGKHRGKNQTEQEKQKKIKMALYFTTHLIHKYYNFDGNVLQCHWADSIPSNFI